VILEDKMLTRKEAARLLGCSESALRRWAGLGCGPMLVRLGRLVRYRRSALEEFIAENSDDGRASE
jgi:excisionase family DNA binding protein